MTRTPAQEKLAAAVQEYLLERNGSGYYFDQIPITLRNGSPARARVRIEIVPPTPEPDWPEPQRGRCSACGHPPGTVEQCASCG